WAFDHAQAAQRVAALSHSMPSAPSRRCEPMASTNARPTTVTCLNRCAARIHFWNSNLGPIAGPGRRGVSSGANQGFSSVAELRQHPVKSRFALQDLKLSGSSRMAQQCDICGKKPQAGNRISHAHNVTKRRWNINLRPVHAKVNGQG